VSLGPEDPVDLHRIAGQPAELELLLDATDGVALAAPLDRDDQRRPGVGADDAVDGQALVLLEGADGGVGLRPEDPVHGDVMAAGPEQGLQGLDGMPPVTLTDERPWTDRGGGYGHRLLLRSTLKAVFAGDGRGSVRPSSPTPSAGMATSDTSSASSPI